MTATPINLAPALLLLVSFPIYDSGQVLAERLMLEPYPRKAWGSWLCGAWAATLIVIVVQFAVGTVAHFERLGTSFLSFGIATIIYALVLAKLIRKMFPKPPIDAPPSFLLSQFQGNYRYIYASTFILAALPFLIGPSAFGDRINSAPQIFRLIWMGCSIVGFFSPPTLLRVHKAIIVVAGPLTVALLVIYSVLSSG